VWGGHQVSLPRDAVKVMTMILPKIDRAMTPAITRFAVSFPKTTEKNKTPISRLLFICCASDIAQNYVCVSLLPRYAHYVGLTYATLTRTNRIVAISMAVKVAFAKFLLGL
jgi:hypothetical protein